MRACIIVFALALAASQGSAQTAAQQSSDPRVARADSLFIARDFRGAASAYAAAGVTDNRSRYRYAMSLANSGNPESAAPILDQLAVNGSPVVLFNAGSVQARLGRPDTAFAYLNMSIGAGFSSLPILSADSGYARLRGDGRYAAVEKRLRDAFTPCVNNPEYHKFDFWVGEWTVTNVAGQPAGSSSVQKILSECVVLENWTDAQGGQGKSFNSFNRSLTRWQQFWVDQYGNVTEYRESEWAGSALRYLATTVNRQGATVHLRMTFTPLDANSVRQHGETSTDGGKTWTMGYDLRYTRKK